MRPDSISRPRSRLAGFLAATGASLLIATSAALGSYYGFTVGAHHHIILGVALAAAAFGGELLKPFAVLGAIQALSEWQPVRFIACLALGVVCIVYSLCAELSLAAGSRGDLAASRGAAVETAKQARQRRTAAETELAALPPTRPAAELEAQIAGLLQTPGADGCVEINGKVTRAVCPQVAALRAELGRAQRRAKLEATVTTAEAEIRETAGVRDADPLATSLATYATAAGWPVEAAKVSPWLALLPVLFLELGSALGLVVVRAVSGPVAAERSQAAEPRTEPRVDTRIEPKVADDSVDSGKPQGSAPDVSKVAPQKRPRGQRLGQLGSVTKASAETRIVDTLREHGGRLERASVRGIAALIGGRKSTVHNAMAALIAAGVVAKVGGEIVLSGAV